MEWSRFHSIAQEVELWMSLVIGTCWLAKKSRLTIDSLASGAHALSSVLLHAFPITVIGCLVWWPPELVIWHLGIGTSLGVLSLFLRISQTIGQLLQNSN